MFVERSTSFAAELIDLVRVVEGCDGLYLIGELLGHYVELSELEQH